MAGHTYKLRDFGSYPVGGRVHRVTEGEPFTVNFTRSVAHEVDPRGHFLVEHGYVQFFIPADRNGEPPVVLVHGGGLAGSCWENTPDDRPGWIHLLLDRGYEVHVLDNVERGRAGFAPGLWEGGPILRSQEEAWDLFRIGPASGFAERKPFEGQLFPVGAFDRFSRSFIPRWTSTTPLQTAALLAVLEKTGPSIVVCHSQGGEIAFDACRSDPSKFDRIVAVEPSAPADGVEVPLTMCAGDFLDTSKVWTERDRDWRAAVDGGAGRAYLGAKEFGPGNSHMLMMDSNNAEVLEAVLQPA